MPTNEWEQLSAEARSLYERRDLQGALDAYLRLLRRQPDSAETLNDLGTVCFELGRLGESERYYVRALALDPHYGEAERNLRMFCQAVGRDFQAVLARAEAERPAENRAPSLDISAIMPVRNGFDVFDRCLDALHGQTFPPERYEVLVVANGVQGTSERELQSVMERWKEHFGDRLALHTIEAASIPMARNEGIRHARGRVILQLNSDTALSRTALAEHYAEHEGFGFDPRCVVAGGRKFPRSYMDSLFNYLYEAIHLYTALHCPRPRFLADYTWFVTCNLSCMREAYHRFGTYDESFAWGSDQVLGRQWEREHGAQIYVNAGIIGYHLHPLSFDFWRNKCIISTPFWLRRTHGVSVDQLSAEDGRAVSEQMDALGLDVPQFEREIRRIEQSFSGPANFQGETVMGRPAPTLEHFVGELGPLLVRYLSHLHFSELLRLIRQRTAGDEQAAMPPHEGIRSPCGATVGKGETRLQ